MTRRVDYSSPWARRIMQRTPRLFAEGPMDPSKAVVAFGFECGPGWFPLIEKTLARLARLAKEDGLDDMRVRQIKEKFGELRIYLSGGNDRAQAVVAATQLQSLKTCDLCGGAVLTTPPQVGWLVTRCAACVAGKVHAEHALRFTRQDCGPEQKLYRVLILADLHLDFWLEAKSNPLPGLDNQVFDKIDRLILAGDITNKSHVRWRYALEWLAERVNLNKVWVVPGNHDYYSGALDRDEKLRGIIEGLGGHYAQKADFRLGGRRFQCTTLWTDMSLGGDVTANLAAAAKGMNDYRYIRTAAREYARLRPIDTIALHQDHLTWLDSRLSEPFDGETVVVTHHPPLPDCLPDGHPLPSAYASDLSALILKHQPLMWVHGHIHVRKEFQLGRTRILNVALGYPPAVDPELPRNDPLAGLITWVGSKESQRPKGRPR